MTGLSALQVMGALLSLAGALTLSGLALLLFYEAWAILTRRKLVTDHVRAQVSGRPRVALLVTAVLFLVLGHFLWH